jgi:hypothetical protein
MVDYGARRLISKPDVKKQGNNTTVKPLRASLLGEQTAENDTKLLLSNFIETPEYRSIIETKDSTVVVGRRGTGKSAMFAKLLDFWGSQKATNVIAIAPEDHQAISFRSIFRPFEGKLPVAADGAGCSAGRAPLRSGD